MVLKTWCQIEKIADILLWTIIKLFKLKEANNQLGLCTFFVLSCLIRNKITGLKVQIVSCLYLTVLLWLTNKRSVWPVLTNQKPTASYDYDGHKALCSVSLFRPPVFITWYSLEWSEYLASQDFYVFRLLYSGWAI